MNIEHQYKQDFEHVLTLIHDARDRAYNKANSELVLLYFNVGKIVSEKVDAGTWGEKTVQQLADFIQSKAPNLSGFNSIHRFDFLKAKCLGVSEPFFLFNTL